MSGNDYQFSATRWYSIGRDKMTARLNVLSPSDRMEKTVVWDEPLSRLQAIAMLRNLAAELEKLEVKA